MKLTRRQTRLPQALFLISILALSCAGMPAPAGRKVTTNSFADYFESRGIPRLESTQPLLYFSSSAWIDRALALVEGAKDYILISSFLTNSHEINEKILSALERKAREGVRVYLMFDSASYFVFMPDGVTYLPTPLTRFAGTKVKVTEFNPISGVKLFALTSLLERDHRKFWIIDGKTFATGGMNLNYHSFAPSGPYSNIDTFVELQGEEVLSAMVASFCRTWNRYSPEVLHASSFAIRSPDGRNAEAPLAEMSSVWLFDSIPGEKETMNILFDAFFQNAREEIWMVQAYAFPTDELIGKIRAATGRGVAVNILLSENSFRTSYEKASKYRISDLLKAGAKVYMFDAPDDSFLHYKLMLADGLVAAFGSPNYNFRSQYLSREMAVVSADPAVGRMTWENLRGLVRYATPITAEKARQFRGLDYQTAWLSMLLGG